MSVRENLRQKSGQAKHLAGRETRYLRLQVLRAQFAQEHLPTKHMPVLHAFPDRGRKMPRALDHPFSRILWKPLPAGDRRGRVNRLLDVDQTVVR